MLAPQRQAQILTDLQSSGGVRVSDLVRKLGVSDMTIRRDLEALARRGLLEKVHGGATLPVQPVSEEPGFVAKSARELQEKDSIGRAAARLVEPGATVAISAGTTTWALAKHLGTVPGLTVVTNSVPVADALSAAEASDRTVILTGGVRTPSNGLVGSVAVASLRSLHVDVVFMGVHGMDERAGLTTPNLAEADTNRAMIESGRRLVVVADHTKWGTVALARFAQVDDIDVVVSDRRLPGRAVEVLGEAAEVVLAGSEDADAGTSGADGVAEGVS
ncbi:DeoR family transcriptional regulator [Motilibacter rhizosphaerae]|uniref:DeoR family transcriptional regulator n=1 Tax=Motilibacter rhizosphaerae TaxID=598652 RepID=A0A4Q7NQC6_9ACTN|nr:DeoR/GlpR family DNA-binding transcription regulator [Motilibacter rhizosphaerae]RZS87521.1 DeoR family transcriptional regulator [Motilibacter rhizosphaerae]